MPSLSISMSLFPNNLNSLQAGLADNAALLSKRPSPTSVMSNINPTIPSIWNAQYSCWKKPTKKVCYCVLISSTIDTQFWQWNWYQQVLCVLWKACWRYWNLEGVARMLLLRHMKAALMMIILIISSLYLFTLLSICYLENTRKCSRNLAHKNCMKF